MIVNINESKYAEKEALRTELDKLFWENPEAYIQLCRYCEARRNKISPEIKKELIKKGFLGSKGGLLRTTNEVVYEAVMGQKPFWLE